MYSLISSYCFRGFSNLWGKIHKPCVKNGTIQTYVMAFTITRSWTSIAFCNLLNFWTPNTNWLRSVRTLRSLIIWSAYRRSLNNIVAGRPCNNVMAMWIAGKSSALNFFQLCVSKFHPGKRSLCLNSTQILLVSYRRTFNYSTTRNYLHEPPQLLTWTANSTTKTP